VSLAETYSGPIFQITGLVGIAWIAYIGSSNQDVQFLNESIRFQTPVLLGVVLIKYMMLACNGFKSKRSLYYMNVAGYVCFLVIVFVLDYRIEFFGE
jgi:Ca2+/Na+ antiporter